MPENPLRTHGLDSSSLYATKWFIGVRRGGQKNHGKGVKNTIDVDGMGRRELFQSGT